MPRKNLERQEKRNSAIFKAFSTMYMNQGLQEIICYERLADRYGLEADTIYRIVLAKKKL